MGITRVDGDLLGELAGLFAFRARSASGRVNELLDEALRLGRFYRAAAGEAFEALSQELARLLPGEFDPALVRVPPMRLACGPGPTRWAEPVELEDLVDLGLGAVLRLAGVGSDVRIPVGGALIAHWGQAVGRAMGFSPMYGVALGEFCRGWLFGISCRFGNLDALVAELEYAFAGALAGRAADSPVMLVPEERRLFPSVPEEADAYRLAWRAVLGVLRGAAEDRWVYGDIRLRDQDGVPAAVRILEELGGEDRG